MQMFGSCHIWYIRILPVLNPFSTSQKRIKESVKIGKVREHMDVVKFAKIRNNIINLKNKMF